jgi:ATP-dependent Clp protease protease subunit
MGIVCACYVRPSRSHAHLRSGFAVQNEQIQQVKKELYEIIALHTGQTYDQVLKDCDRDYFMRAKEAKAYGCCDEILIRDKSQKK